MTILKLTAENVKRLSVVEITPNGAPVVVVAGENEAGKSSVLDAIEYLLRGERYLPAEPVRRGAAKAEIVADLGDIIVTRRIAATGGSSLVVKAKDTGAKYPSPQAMLDGLISRLSFDPMAFAQADPPVQAQTLRALAGVDTTDLEVARKKAFDERTLVNRDKTQAEAALAKAPHHPDAGTDLESFDALSAELAAADKLAMRLSAAEQAVSIAEAKGIGEQQRALRLSERIETLHKELAETEAAYEQAQMAIATAEDTVRARRQERDQAAAAIPDRAALRQRIGTIEARNRKVVDNQRRAELAAQVAEKRAAADTLTAAINNCDVTKAEALASATFPIVGLGLDPDTGTVTWQGYPFSQASTAVRTRVSVAIGLALNPKLKVLLVRNGNDLGEKNLALIADAAQAAGAQVWVERIAGGAGQATVVIEDGTVVTSQPVGAP